LDWEFHAGDEHLVVTARAPDGEPYEFDIERPEDVPFGLEFDPPRIRRCANRCDFCFVDGLPEGLRTTLYIRDDDYRLSFRYGNFATLTNLKPKDVERITEYRLSPLYVSVHATDPIVRRRLLRNPRAPAIIPQLEAFAAAGIHFHTQVVLQPGVNDGPVLERTLSDLYALQAAVLSVSVVPVGLTEFSKGHLVREPTPAECRDAVRLVEAFQRRALAERRVRWAYGSDDLYLVADCPLPPPEAYDGFEQVENGVGAVRFLEQAVRDQASEIGELAGRRIGVLTGTGMARLMPIVLATLTEVTGAAFELVVVENTLFGPSVTSAGLLPGRDFLRALETIRCDVALLPAEAVNDRGAFLDDLSWQVVRDGASVPVRLSSDFADALTDPEFLG
jgi:putative radical SAM enzyme (TIGR03279 family)